MAARRSRQEKKVSEPRGLGEKRYDYTRKEDAVTRYNIYVDTHLCGTERVKDVTKEREKKEAVRRFCNRQDIAVSREIWALEVVGG